MLRTSVPEELSSFHDELIRWLDSVAIPSCDSPSLDEFVRVGRLWQGMLAKERFIGVHWPEEYGGRGLPIVAEAIVQEELARRGAPQILGLFGLSMVGPVLIQHGTEDQRKAYLKDILSGDRVWCQGFSEPGAGSDLAALRTTAEKDGEEYRISGQKVWTSFAHMADYCFLLCRTSTDSQAEGNRSKHKGLSYLLVPMDQKGISTRSLKQISGDDEFNEVFFEDCRVPISARVGEEGEGWKIAISTLMYERIILTFSRHIQSETLLREMLRVSPEEARVELEDSIAELCAVRSLAYRHLREYVDGRVPGPEGSLDKLFWSESFQRLTSKGKSLLNFESFFRSAEGSEEELFLHQYLYSRGRTIAAGTSEIQRNIIAERLLGLPRLKKSS